MTAQSEHIRSELYRGHLQLAAFGQSAQQMWEKARVLCIGAGGLAAHALPLLTTAGIKTIDIVDDDIVVTSNLQRQTLFTLADRGEYKAVAAVKRLSAINQQIALRSFITTFTVQEAARVTDYDLVLDCADNVTTTQLINHACTLAAVPWVYASVEKSSGQLALFTPGTACYSCLFATEDPTDSAPSCSTRGVFAPAVATLGALQASISLSYLANTLPSPTTFNLIDLQNFAWRSFQMQHDQDCLVCQHKVPLAATPPTPNIAIISVRDFAVWRQTIRPTLLDIRSTAEYYKDNIGGVSLPYERLIADHGVLDKTTPLCIICNRGNTSKQAALLLARAGFTAVSHLAGGMAEWHAYHTHDDYTGAKRYI